ncbi:MAG TPA: endonuclease/exonuclease/phosphatase family protein [Candidatus Synoicihabitans sp.]|nr:endonuclease/exonuclease/phosphatase family protein [Candidatus Synoicihabitans sp.]
MFRTLTGGTLFLLLATLLPLSRHPAWWIRGWDFPRFQLAVFGLALLSAQVIWLDFDDLGPWLLSATTAACVIYQGIWIFPYTPFFSREVHLANQDQATRRIRLLTANVLTPNRRVDAFLQLVKRHRPDVIVTVETNQWWEDHLEPELSEYPHRLRCPLENLYGMHVFSRLPIEDDKTQFLVEKDKPSMHFLVVLPSGDRIRLHCLHPAPPSPTENDTSSERDAELVMVGRAVAHARLPVIVSGDLNDVAWSRTTRLFRKVSGLLDPRVGRGMYNTFHARFPCFRWPVDHVFHSRHFGLIRLERLPQFGSDHFPMLVELELDPTTASEQSDEGLDADAEDEALAHETTAAEAVTPNQVHRPGERGTSAATCAQHRDHDSSPT